MVTRKVSKGIPGLGHLFNGAGAGRGNEQRIGPKQQQSLRGGGTYGTTFLTEPQSERRAAVWGCDTNCLQIFIIFVINLIFFP